MIGLEGLEISDLEREMLLNPLVGGVILFTRNYESIEQVTALVAGLHGLKEPGLLISIDHEGGRVQRFRKDFTVMPAVRNLGVLFDKDARQARELAELSGWLMAVECRSIGVDFSFAPILDMDRGISDIIGDRAFHSDPEIITDLANAYVRGMRSAGMVATGKHFPGHGGVVEDSHVALPIDRRPFEDIMMEDLVPFERLINNGMEAVMVAHVIYEQIDPGLAGFSKFWLQDVLRTRLGFQGVIFSDDLEMEGAAIVGGLVDRATLALEAGCDMVLVCQTQQAAIETLDGLPEWNNPASAMRLARLHGKKPVTRGELHGSQKWQEAVVRVTGASPQAAFKLV